jgi:solute carrier family 29 (equilibrative nucleoside transporter), member 1/2/3
MNKIRALFSYPVNGEQYEPLGEARPDDEEPTITPEDPLFSWVDYSVFLLLGVAMLWSW